MPDFMQTIQYRMDNTDGLDNRRKQVMPGLPTEAPTIGGVYKKFSPTHGLVWAPTPEGQADFPKETTAQRQLMGWVLPNGNSVGTLFFSFQNELGSGYEDTGTELHQQTRLYRSVSLYNVRQIGSLPLQEPTLRLDRYVPSLQAEANDRAVRVTVQRIIHQIIFIHYALYKSSLLHGDLHMGNIKVIIDNHDFPVIKAFDFGKSKIVTSADDRLKDLKYLCLREAVSGWAETFKRNTWRNDNSAAQTKHYPLHRLAMILARGARKDAVYARIETLSRPLISNLQTAVRRPLPSGQTSKLFQQFADTLIQDPLLQ